MTTMKDLQKQLVPAAVEHPGVAAGFSTVEGFELIQREAKCLAAADLLPERYRGNVPNAVIALDMANRMGAAPLMVCQNLYVVHGTPAWSAQFLIATFNQCGKFSALRYEFCGKQGADDWGCRAWAIEKETGARLDGSLITIGLAKKEGWYGKSGSKWQTMPEQMLRYRAAAWFIRAHAPEIAMGLPMQDEVLDGSTIVDVTPQTTDPEQVQETEPETQTVTEAIPDPAPADPPVLVPEEESQPQPEPKEDPVKRGKKETYPATETPQLKLFQALAAPCDGDEVEMQKLLNAVTGGEKYTLADIPGFTNFVAERLLQTLEEHLKRIEGEVKP